MTSKIDSIQQRWYPPQSHPYVKFEERVRSHLCPDAVVLDAGCGRGAPVLRKLAPMSRRAIGIDLLLAAERVPGIELISADLHAIPISTGSVNLILSRSVLEHIKRPKQVFSEFARVLCAGGHLICLTPNKWDYASLIAMAIPNSWHPAIVNATEGRARSQVFPTYYRANTKRRLTMLSNYSGLKIEYFEYLGQYPNYLAFSPLLFKLGCYYDHMLAALPALHWLRGWILIDLIKPLTKPEHGKDC